MGDMSAFSRRPSGVAVHGQFIPAGSGASRPRTVQGVTYESNWHRPASTTVQGVTSTPGPRAVPGEDPTAYWFRTGVWISMETERRAAGTAISRRPRPTG